jgi:dynein intermediate chain 2
MQATKYVIGTEQGTILVANKKARKPIEITHRYGPDNRHLGPIYSINRNLQSSKIFMTVGDWSAKIWMDDLKTPLVRTKFHGSYLTDGCFSPTRVGAFFLTRKVQRISFRTVSSMCGTTTTVRMKLLFLTKCRMLL